MQTETVKEKYHKPQTTNHKKRTTDWFLTTVPIQVSQVKKKFKKKSFACSQEEV